MTALHPACRTAFLNHVSHVVFMGAEKQMRRIDAGWVIATGAVVQNVQTIRDRTVVQFPRQPMCIDDAWGTVAVERPIAIPSRAASPQPALARRVNVLPKPEGWGDGTITLGASRGAELSTASIEFRLPGHELALTDGAGSRDDSLRGHRSQSLRCRAPGSYRSCGASSCPESLSTSQLYHQRHATLAQVKLLEAG